MKRRKSYFISLNKNTITRISVPDAAEYEVVVTHGELTELRRLISTYKGSSAWLTLQNLVFNPLEGDSHSARIAENKHLKDVYRFIYNHGTEETKNKIESIEIIQKQRVK